MLSQTQLLEISKRLETTTDASSPLREDMAALIAEVVRLTLFVADFSSEVTDKLAVLDQDLVKFEKENARLKAVCEGAYFERDACIGLISKMATQMGIPVGTAKFDTQNRVVIDLPSGQVSWDYLASEAHLFESLPKYERSLQEQSVQDVYSKIMNPSFDGSSAI